VWVSSCGRVHCVRPRYSTFVNFQLIARPRTFPSIHELLYELA